MYLYRNIEVCPSNNRCSGKAIGITYSEAVFVALVTQHAMHMCHTVICCLLGCTIFSHIDSYTARSSKNCYWTQTVFIICVNKCTYVHLLTQIINNTSAWYEHKKMKCVFRFCLHLLSATFLILRRTARDMTKKCLSVFMYSTRYCRQILKKLEFSRHFFFEKYSNIKFHGTILYFSVITQHT